MPRISQRKNLLSQESFQPSSDINVTPLVDVMLVLLVIFMISTPLIHNTTDINLPEVKMGKSKPEHPQTTVVIKKNGSLLINKRNTHKSDFSNILRKTAEPNAPVYVAADKTLSYGSVMEIMSMIDASGYKMALLSREQ